MKILQLKYLMKINNRRKIILLLIELMKENLNINKYKKLINKIIYKMIV